VKCDEAGVAHAREHEIQLLLRLKAKLEWHNERTCDAGKHETFCEGMRNFPAIHDVRLAYGFQSIDTLCIPLANLHDLSETAFANNSSQFEVINGKWLALKERLLEEMEMNRLYTRCST
jgi:hypothetical protein